MNDNFKNGVGPTRTTLVDDPAEKPGLLETIRRIGTGVYRPGGPRLVLTAKDLDAHHARGDTKWRGR